MIESLNRLRPLFTRRDKIRYGILFLLMGGGSVLEVAGLGAVPVFIATMATPDRIRSNPHGAAVLELFGITSNREMVIWGAGVLLALFMVRTAYLIMLRYLQVRMTELHRVRIARRLFAAYMYAPYEFVLGRNSAELLRNVNNETSTIISGIINPILTITLQGLMSLLVVALLVAATPLSGILAVAIVGGGGTLFVQMVRRRMRLYGTEARIERKRAIQAVNQGLGAFQDARVLGVEEPMIEVFNQSNSRAARYSRYSGFIKGISAPLLEFIAVIGLVAVLLALVLAGTSLEAMLPMLGLFAASIMRLRTSIGTIVSRASNLGYNLPSVDAVVNDLDELKSKADEKPTKKSAKLLPLQQEIAFHEVSYTYPGGDAPALIDVSMKIRRGQSVGFVGATGSGKTTLVNLLLGLLEPTRGRITVDGRNILDNLRGWQKNIGFIPQTIYLLDDTIRWNVAFGVPEEELDEEALWTAIRAAQLEEFVHSLPDGLDTVVGERGARLSGGQRQRVGLARALYHNPDVLVMDEGTSALDNQTELSVMQALDSLKGDRTVVMIAHRLSTVRSCDCLYFMKSGRIEAFGTFDELCATDGDFRKMAVVAHAE